MTRPSMFQFWKKVLRSFIFATQGILSALQERNMKVHVMGLALVLFLGIWLRISHLEWIIILILSGLVISAEMVNTAVEELSNIVRDELKLSYGATKRARDVAAGAVLVLAFVSAVIGLSIFIPRIMSILGS